MNGVVNNFFPSTTAIDAVNDVECFDEVVG